MNTPDTTVPAPIPASTLALYRRYDGDADGLARSADRGAEFLEEDWRRLDDLRQRALIVATGQGSEAFCARYRADLSAWLPAGEAREAFDRMAAEDLRAAAAGGGGRA